MQRHWPHLVKRYCLQVCNSIWWRWLLMTGLGVGLQQHLQHTAWCSAMFLTAQLLLACTAATAARAPRICFIVGLAICCMGTVLMASAAVQDAQGALAAFLDSVLQVVVRLHSRTAISLLHPAAVWVANQLLACLTQAALLIVLVYHSNRRAQIGMSCSQQRQMPEVQQKGRQAPWQLPGVHGSLLAARTQFQAATSTNKQLQEQCEAWPQTSAASTRAVEGCVSSGISNCGSSRPAGSSGHAAAEIDVAVVQVGSAAYQSRLQRKLVAIKLQEPPGTGAAELEVVRQRLTVTLQSALCAGGTPTPAAAAAALSAAAAAVHTNNPSYRSLQLQRLPFVAQSVAFSGCYQLVFEVVRPVAGTEQQDSAAAAAGGVNGGSNELEQQQLLHLQQLLEQQVKQQLPAGWQLRGVQMVGHQQGLRDGATGMVSASCSTAPAAAAAAISQPPSWPLVGSAKAADNKAAALACLWSRDSATERGIILQPLAAAWPDAAAAAAAEASPVAGEAACSSGAGSSAAHQQNSATQTMVEAELLLPKALVQHLLQQGHQRVRCVVAAQPEGAVLLDKAQPLLPAVGVGATAAASAAGDLCVQLQFSLDGVLQQQQGSVRSSSTQPPVQVLSVVVLGKEGKRSRRGSEQQQHQQLAAGSMLEAEPAAAAVAGAAVPGVVAHLPLLVLPAAAAAEMQGVVDKAVAVGIDRYKSVQELLLPLIQDWALLVLLSGSSSSSSSSNSSKPRHPLQHMQQSLYNSLAGYFTKNKMDHCQKLLPAAAGSAPGQLASSPRSRQQHVEVPPPPPAAAAAVGSSRREQQQPPQHPPYSVDFYLYTFKIATCTAQHPHDWSTCPFVHPREKARRRDPRVFEYEPLPCPVDKKGSNCPDGDACRYTHNVYEFHLHPKRFRTQMCQHGAACTRPLCFFAHSLDELRVVEPQPQEEQQQQPDQPKQQQQQQGPSTPTESAGTADRSSSAVAALTAPPAAVPAPPAPRAAAAEAAAAVAPASSAAAASVAAAAVNITTSAAAAASGTASSLAGALAVLDLQAPLLDSAAAATMAAPGMPAAGSGSQAGRGASTVVTAAAGAGTGIRLAMQQQLQLRQQLQQQQQQDHFVGDSVVTASGLAVQQRLQEQLWLQGQQAQHRQQQLASGTLYNDGLLYQQAPAAVPGAIPQLQQQQQQQLLLQLQQQLVPNNAASFLPGIRAQALTPRAIGHNPGGVISSMAVLGLQQQPQLQQQQQCVGDLSAIAVPAVQQQGYPYQLAVSVQQQPPQQLLLGPALYELQPQDANAAADAAHFYNLLQ